MTVVGVLVLTIGCWPVRDFERIGLDECVVCWWSVCLELGGEGVVEMLGREDRERVGAGSGR